jgi:putative exporter of polyketide antibiotics
VSTTVALANIQGRKLLRHPVTLAGVGFAVIGTAAFVRAAIDRSVIDWDEDGWTIGAGFLILAILMLVAANLAALRDRREDTVEQFDTLPATRSARTGGLLVGVLWPAVLSAVILELVMVYAASVTDLGRWDQILVAAAQLATVVALGALGVALARWFPSPFVAPFVAWAIIFLAPGDSPSRWHVFSPLAFPTMPDMLAWKIVYLAGIALSFAALALLRDGGRRAALLSGALGVPLVAASLAFLLPGVCPSAGHCLL